MKIQYIQQVTRPREARGGMHEIREVSASIGQPLVDGGYAVFIPVSEVVAEPKPKPKPEAKVKVEPKPVTRTKVRKIRSKP